MFPILYRGQTRMRGQKVNMLTGDELPGNWVYGGIFPGNGDRSVIYGGDSATLTVEMIDKHVVYNDTVGQFSGQTDMAKKEIFQGDILEYIEPEGKKVYGVVYLGDFDYNGLGLHVGFYVQWPVPYMYLRNDLRFWTTCREVRVVGNIHDTPDLLEERYGCS